MQRPVTGTQNLKFFHDNAQPHVSQKSKIQKIIDFPNKINSFKVQQKFENNTKPILYRDLFVKLKL